MRRTLLLALAAFILPASAQIPQFRDLFNGKNLKGWVNVNTDPDTWSVKKGVLI